MRSPLHWAHDSCVVYRDYTKRYHALLVLVCSYILGLMRRKEGILLPIEIGILEAGLELVGKQVDEFHGFLIAKQVKEREDARKLISYGTLYKALSRMENAGVLSSRWEDSAIALDSHRPRRRLYQVTPLGRTALANARNPSPRHIPITEQPLTAF